MAFPPVLIFNPAWQANSSFKQRNMKDEEIQERLALLLVLKRRRKMEINGNTGSDQKPDRVIEELKTEDRKYFFR